MPCQIFIELHGSIVEYEIFSRWTSEGAARVNSSNTQSLLLGALRCIGRAWKIDDIEEATAMPRETNRRYFIAFIERGSSTLYKDTF